MSYTFHVPRSGFHSQRSTVDGQPSTVHGPRFRLALIALLAAAGCGGPGDGPQPLTAEVPLHLEEHLDSARIEGSRVPETAPAAVEWDFSEPRPEWKVISPLIDSREPIRSRQRPDALRLRVTERNHLVLRPGYETYAGGIYVELPDWKLDDWAYVSVRARSTSMGWMELNFNLREEPGQEPDEQSPFLYSSQYVDMIQDGSVQTYLMRADWPGEWKKQWEGPWRQLGIRVGSRQPASIDILSVSVIPKEAEFASARTGVKSQVRGNSLRRALYTHTPARLEYAVRVPEGGRLDLGLGVLRDQMPVSFKVAARAEGRTEVLLEESYADRDHWAQGWTQ